MTYMFSQKTRHQELVWRSGSVMDCHATARGSILGRNGVFNELKIPSQGTVNGGAVSK